MPAVLPLRALQVLETVSRHGSFSRAASELSITQSAVSHQIRALEGRLGTRLFFREGKRVLLTPAGQRLAFSMTSALAQISDAMAAVQPARERQSVTVSVLPSFASTWLLPRLHRFAEAHPAIDVSLVATQHLSEPGRDGSDLAIRYGNGRWSGLQAVQILPESVFPVCSPAFDRGRLPRTPKDLAGLPLIADVFHPWRMWLKAAGVTSTSGLRLVTYTDSGLALQAAERGLGIALGRRVIAGEALRAGRLVQPFELEVRSPLRYYVVYPSGAALRAPAERFVEWVLSEAATEVLSAAGPASTAARRD